MFLDWKRAQLLGPQSILHVLPCWKLHWKSFILIIQFQERPVWSHNFIRARRALLHWFWSWMILPIGSMYAIYGNIYHQYTPNVSICTIHGSYGLDHLPPPFEFDYDILTTLAGPDPSSPSWRHGRNGLDNVAMEWIASGLVDDTQPLGMVSLWW